MNNEEKAMAAIFAAVPYPDQIKNVTTKENAIYFQWRQSTYKYSIRSGWVDVVKGQMLEGSDLSILMQKLISIELKKQLNQEEKSMITNDTLKELGFVPSENEHYYFLEINEFLDLQITINGKLYAKQLHELIPLGVFTDPEKLRQLVQLIKEANS